LVTSRDGLTEVAQDLTQSKGIYLDVETYGENALDPRRGEIRTLTLLRERGTPWIIDLKATGYDLGPVGSVMARTALCAHNALFDLGFLRAKCGFVPNAPVLCTMMMSRMINLGTNNANDLASALKRHLDITLPKELTTSDWGGLLLLDEQLDYAAADVAHLPNLLRALLGEVTVSNLKGATGLECKLLPVIVNMNATGFAVDVPRLEGIKQRAGARASDAAKVMAAKLGGINMASPKQLLQALRDAGHAVESTDNETLQRLKDTELAGGILGYRDAQKLTQQAESLLKAVYEGRIYATFDPTSTRTGRFSCKTPNLQNVARGELRECFIAPPGRSLVVCDYSQVELRLAAYIAKDERMLNAFRDGIDLHAATAGIVLDKAPADVTKQDRQLAKAVNFGLIYGQSARGLVRYAKSSYGVELPERRAHEIRDKFFRAYTGLARWHKVAAQDARGFVSAEARTLLGRRQQLLDGDWWPRFTRLVNTPVQGTAADGMKKALVRLAKALPKGAQVVATVHDEIVVECDEAQAPDVLTKTKTAMIEGMAEIAKDCPIEVEGGTGESWGAAK
jgi:DNA polymerase-1